MFDKRIEKYLIPNALVFLNKWCAGYKIKLLVKNARDSKLGDYRKLGKDVHQITLNTGMTAELTFFTLTHEIAHMHAREQYGNRIKPHGREWKFTFSQLILESYHLYPKAMHSLLIAFAKKPKASFYASRELATYFIQEEKEVKLLLKDIPLGAKFKIKEKIYKKGNLRKIRYLCTEISSGRKFTIHMLAPIDEVIED